MRTDCKSAEGGTWKSGSKHHREEWMKVLVMVQWGNEGKVSACWETQKAMWMRKKSSSLPHFSDNLRPAGLAKASIHYASRKWRRKKTRLSEKKDNAVIFLTTGQCWSSFPQLILNDSHFHLWNTGSHLPKTDSGVPLTLFRNKGTLDFTGSLNQSLWGQFPGNQEHCEEYECWHLP